MSTVGASWSTRSESTRCFPPARHVHCSKNLHAYLSASGTINKDVDLQTVTALLPTFMSFDNCGLEIPFGDVHITSGFWLGRLEATRTGALPAMYDQMKKTGRWDCLKLKWKPGDPNKPCVMRNSSSVQADPFPGPGIDSGMPAVFKFTFQIRLTLSWQGFGHREVARGGMLLACPPSRSWTRGARGRGGGYDSRGPAR